MPSAAPSTWRYYVVVTEMWTVESVRGSRGCQNPFHLSSGSCDGVLFCVTRLLLLSPQRSLYSLCLLFLFCSGRDTAEHIEAVAGRAVNASKQTFALLIDLLQDNSTEEYIRNLTER